MLLKTAFLLAEPVTLLKEAKIGSLGLECSPSIQSKKKLELNNGCTQEELDRTTMKHGLANNVTNSVFDGESFATNFW